MVVIWVYLFSSILLTGCVYDKNKDVNEPPESLPDKESSDSSGQSSILPENDEKDDISPQEILKGIAYYEAEAPLLDFEAVDLNGNKVKLSDYEGSIVFLNFWGTWCPRRREMPHMEQFYKEYKEKGVVLLAVSPTSVEL